MPDVPVDQLIPYEPAYILPVVLALVRGRKKNDRPIKVARSADGTLLVIDGTHRVRAAYEKSTEMISAIYDPNPPSDLEEVLEIRRKNGTTVATLPSVQTSEERRVMIKDEIDQLADYLHGLSEGEPLGSDDDDDIQF